MKETGIVRKIDSFGRIVLPMETRRIMDLDSNSLVELYIDGDMIVMRKYNPACIFCGEIKGLKPYAGKLICASCAKKIGKLGGDEA